MLSMCYLATLALYSNWNFSMIP